MSKLGILGYRLETHCTLCGRITSNTPTGGICPVCYGVIFSHFRIPWGMKLVHDTLNLYGRWRLTAHYKGTDKVFKVLEGDNLIVTVGKTLVGNMLIDLAAQWDTGLTYCALGSDNTAPAIGQTQLVDEGGGVAMRKTITSKTIVANEITLSTFFTAAQSTLAIEEAAIFGSSTADGTENSGVMFSRWLSSFDNSLGNFDLTFDYTLLVG